MVKHNWKVHCLCVTNSCYKIIKESPMIITKLYHWVLASRVFFFSLLVGDMKSVTYLFWLAYFYFNKEFILWVSFFFSFSNPTPNLPDACVLVLLVRLGKIVLSGYIPPRIPPHTKRVSDGKWDARTIWPNFFIHAYFLMF